MKITEKLFGGLHPTWIRIITFAVFIGIYTGIVLTIPALKNTSFRDIGVGFEWWILFAMLIISNSKSPPESAGKTFLFFLISQPLAFLVQPAGVDLFLRYYGGWFIWTLFTFPMAWIGWYTRKNNIMAALILAPMLVMLLGHFYDYVRIHHILSAIFCLGQVILLIFGILKEKKKRIFAGILSAAVTCLLELNVFLINS